MTVIIYQRAFYAVLRVIVSIFPITPINRLKGSTSWLRVDPMKGRDKNIFVVDYRSLKYKKTNCKFTFIIFWQECSGCIVVPSSVVMTLDNAIKAAFTALYVISLRLMRIGLTRSFTTAVHTPRQVVLTQKRCHFNIVHIRYSLVYHKLEKN